MDGMELIQSLKADPQLRQIPTLVLTAKPNENISISMLKLGVDDYLLKPFDEQELKASIAHLLLQAAASNENRLEEENEELLLKEPTKGTYQKDLIWLATLDTIIQPKIGDFNLTMDTIADEVHLSVSQLNRKLKSLTGLTTKKYVREIRFQEARKMLENRTYNSVKAVTYSVGFKSEKYFSRYFKQRFGKYPSELLKEV